MKKKNSHKIAISGMIIALYVAVMFFSQSFSFGQFQIRIATSLYSIAAVYPFLIIPLGIANLLSNLLFGGLGLLDIFGGFFVGILTAYACFKSRKLSIYLVAIPIVLIPSLLVSLWLNFILNVPYQVLLISIGIGQIIPSIIGVFLVMFLEKIQLGKKGNINESK